MSELKKEILLAIRRNDATTLRRLVAEEETLPSLAGETFKGLHASGLKLTGLDLSNTEWEACLLDDSSFDGADLSGTYIHGSTLMGCSFNKSNLEGAAFEGCVFKRIEMDGATLNESEFSDNQFSNSTLKNLVLQDVEWSSIIFNDGTLHNISGSGNISGLTIRGTKIEGFDTSALEIKKCVIAPLEGQTPPAGFTILSGRRKRV